MVFIHRNTADGLFGARQCEPWQQPQRILVRAWLTCACSNFAQFPPSWLLGVESFPTNAAKSPTRPLVRNSFSISTQVLVPTRE